MAMNHAAIVTLINNSMGAERERGARASARRSQAGAFYWIPDAQTCYAPARLIEEDEVRAGLVTA